MVEISAAAPYTRHEAIGKSALSTISSAGEVRQGFRRIASAERDTSEQPVGLGQVMAVAPVNHETNLRMKNTKI